MDVKKRRHSSYGKEFKGDHLEIGKNKSVLAILNKHREKRVVFSGILQKVNKRSKAQERLFLLTEKALYNLTKGYSVKRRIEISKISSLKMSTFDDNFLAIEIKSEYSYLINSPLKIELVLRLTELYKEITTRELNVFFEDQFILKISKSVWREIKFLKVESGVLTELYQVDESSKK
ncbi:hypothetical protein M0813_03478 [Anaeramoeba flamelloides]|uniref:TH1 domain-containing protein n=1 Tax=Anaeramoeba flamelloides TaxID=1746091 RepID=A0ABQ8XWS7_9EUKA|nr:hypothetical protein M0813_03478 [Anaeramoeba flamelloides]